MTPPLLSVVVTIVEGGEALLRLLDALAAQRDPPPMEILVPFDDSVSEVRHLAARHPAVRFLPMGTVMTAMPVASAGGQHELYDRRRSAALAQATGELVAIVEDRGLPRPDWARTAVELHRQPSAVIGGAIEPASPRLVDWALHVADYSRYSLPFAPHTAAWVSDVNVVYKRRALEDTRSLWQDRFHEPVVHWALQQAGEELRLEPSLVVDHRRERAPLFRLLGERWHWGRLFGAIRGRAMPVWRRLGMALVFPLIPVVLVVRHARVQARRREMLRFVRALPILLILLLAWSAGEAWGTLTRRS